MKKLVLKLDLHDDKDKSKALRIVSGLAGVDAVVPDMNVKKLTVIGTVDPVRVVSKLRKFWHTEIVSAGPAREPTKKEEKKEEGKKDEPKKEEAKEEEKKEEPKKEEANRKKRRRRNWDQRREARLTGPTILPYHTGHTSILSHAHTLSKRIEMRALSSNLVRYRILDSQLVVAVDANPTTYARTEKML